jgi:GWxTD domain-containing protein
MYRRAGMIAEGGAVPFTGIVRYFAGPSPDSTLVLLSLSLANRSLTFSVEGNQYRAAYRVESELHRGAGQPQRIEARKMVRVQAYRETARGDESIVFQHLLLVAPGEVDATLTVSDEPSQRATSTQLHLAIPRFGAGDLSTPVVVYEGTPRKDRDSLPVMIASPRATAVFGRDSVVLLYVEAYGAPPHHVVVRAIGEKAREVWRDTVALASGAGLSSAVITLPVSRIGAGALTIATSTDRDTTSTPLFISFGEEWALTSYAEMLEYLRYFATAEELNALKRATPEQRAEAWNDFWKATDPVPTTQENEALRDYFARIRIANERFGEEGGAGWLTDRGRVLLLLGDPDQIYEQDEMSLRQRGRAQIWVYNRYQVQLAFVDQSGFGRWRLTMSSEADLASAARQARR